MATYKLGRPDKALLADPAVVDPFVEHRHDHRWQLERTTGPTVPLGEVVFVATLPARVEALAGPDGGDESELMQVQRGHRQRPGTVGVDPAR